MALRGLSPRWWRGASLLLALALGLSMAAASLAADYDGERPDYVPSYPEEDDGSGTGRRSTWELSTSLTFYRYLDPFPRVDSARVCRNRCANDRQCTGWTYYDANFNDAGRLSYKLQRLCVLGAGVRTRQSGNRPGRISGELSTARHDGPRGGGN
jgi:hypothetical protein